MSNNNNKKSGRRTIVYDMRNAPKAEVPKRRPRALRQSRPQREVVKTLPINTAMDKVSTVPNITRALQSTRIKHRELIGDVIGTREYTVAKVLRINPGNSEVFPWLSGQALGWESYKFHSLRVTYVSRCGSIQQGSVMLVPDYDPTDLGPATEVVASGFSGTKEFVPWVVSESITLPPNRLNHTLKSHFIRTGGVPPGDLKLFDAAQVFVCTNDSGTTNPVVFGKLWVEYDVELMIPQNVVTPKQVVVAGGAPTGDNYFGDPGVPGPLRDVASSVAGQAGNVLATLLSTNKQVKIEGLTPGNEYQIAWDASGTGLSSFRPFATGSGAQGVFGGAFNTFDHGPTASGDGYAGVATFIADVVQPLILPWGFSGTTFSFGNLSLNSLPQAISSRF